MSPFFRGSVRPTKKHPRPWSLNPKLNPDLGKDDAPTTRMSILGLPSQKTDIILPVFNGVYTRDSAAFKGIAKPLVNGDGDHHTAALAEPAEIVPAELTAHEPQPQVHEIILEEDEAETAHPTEVTNGHTSQEVNAIAPEEAQPAVPYSSAEAAQMESVDAAPIEETTSAATPASKPSVSAPETPAQAAPPVEEAAHEPSASDKWPLPAEPSASTAAATKDSPAPVAPEPATDAAAKQDSWPLPANDSPPSAEGSAEAAAPEVAVSSEQTPPAVESGATKDSSVPVRESPAESLSTIKEEKPRESEQQIIPDQPLPAPVEDPSLPSISEEEVAGADQPDEDEATPVGEAAPEPLASPEESVGFYTPFEAPAATKALGHGDSTAAGGEEDSAAEPPVIPRHPSADLTSLASGVQRFANGHTREGSGSVSVESSAAAEPLISDAQLDVSDEFRPGVQI